MSYILCFAHHWDFSLLPSTHFLWLGSLLMGTTLYWAVGIHLISLLDPLKSVYSSGSGRLSQIPQSWFWFIPQVWIFLINTRAQTSLWYWELSGKEDFRSMPMCLTAMLMLLYKAYYMCICMYMYTYERDRNRERWWHLTECLMTIMNKRYKC